MEIRMNKRHNKENLGDSLLESVAKAGAADIAGDVSEMALDAVLKEGLLKGIPVFDWLANLYTVTKTVRDQLFLKKVASFLYGTKFAKQEAKDKFRERMAADQKYRREVGENLILLLERHDHFDKSTLLGKVFAEYINGEVVYETFLRIATSIDRVSITDLRHLPSHKERLDLYEGKIGVSVKSVLKDDTCQSLYTSGLVRSDGVYEVTYHPNDVMAVLVKLMTKG